MSDSLSRIVAPAKSRGYPEMRGQSMLICSVQTDLIHVGKKSPPPLNVVCVMLCLNGSTEKRLSCEKRIKN